MLDGIDLVVDAILAGAVIPFKRMPPPSWGGDALAPLIYE